MGATTNLPPLWPHQQRAVGQLREAVASGARSVILACPTGGGKTRIMTELASGAAQRGRRVALFASRRILIGQASQRLSEAGLGHGVVMAGAGGYRLDEACQVVSVPTVASRVFRKESWELPPADLVLIDEAHHNRAETAAAIIRHYREQGGVVIGFTATPVGLKGLYERLVVAATNSELRQCGAIVPCDVFAPSEPDMKGVKRNAVGEYAAEGMVRRVMQTLVFGDVFDHWKRLNPWGRPTLLWAPGVKESRWFVEELRSRGVAAEHIDGETPDEERQRIADDSREGRCKVVSSYGVLREGVDWPWVTHGILVQVCGLVSTYLQMVGRILRAADGKDRAILQDHSGAWHRHGSPNVDRQWELDDTDRSIALKRVRVLQAGMDSEGICCGECGGVRKAGPVCPHCGKAAAKSVRRVRMTDGSLRKMTGPAVRVVTQAEADQKAWTSCLYAAASRGLTVGQARGWFQQKHGRPLPANLRNVPAAGSVDWDRRVSDVFPWVKPKGRASRG